MQLVGWWCRPIQPLVWMLALQQASSMSYCQCHLVYCNTPSIPTEYDAWDISGVGISVLGVGHNWTGVFTMNILGQHEAHNIFCSKPMKYLISNWHIDQHKCIMIGTTYCFWFSWGFHSWLLSSVLPWDCQCQTPAILWGGSWSGHSPSMLGRQLSVWAEWTLGNTQNLPRIAPSPHSTYNITGFHLFLIFIGFIFFSCYIYLNKL